MDRHLTPAEARAAASFARAAAFLAREAVLAASRESSTTLPARALALAGERARELEALAQEGVDLAEAYAAAARALDEAAFALADARERPKPFVPARLAEDSSASRLVVRVDADDAAGAEPSP